MCAATFVCEWLEWVMELAGQGAMPNLREIIDMNNKDWPSEKLREACEKRGVGLRFREGW